MGNNNDNQKLQQQQQQNFVKLEAKNISISSGGLGGQPEVPVKRNEALQSKPGTQIKITRTPSGGVEFTTVPASGSGSGVPVPQQQDGIQHQPVPAAFASGAPHSELKFRKKSYFRRTQFKIFKKELHLPSPIAKTGDVFCQISQKLHFFVYQGVQTGRTGLNN